MISFQLINNPISETFNDLGFKKPVEAEIFFYPKPYER
jgi:hypothetical protein